MNDGYIIRLAKSEELCIIRSIYDCAKNYMDASGNPDQWSKGYPPNDAILEDIKEKILFMLCEKDSNIPHAAFEIINGPDPTYAKIEGGWLNDKPYLAVHRVASDGFFRGVVGKITDYVFANYKEENIRIDTHADNLPMQRALSAKGYRHCGTIYLENGSPRRAYQLKKEL